jgi:hypothetical protein
MYDAMLIASSRIRTILLRTEQLGITYGSDFAYWVLKFKSRAESKSTASNCDLTSFSAKRRFLEPLDSTNSSALRFMVELNLGLKLSRACKRGGLQKIGGVTEKFSDRI